MGFNTKNGSIDRVDYEFFTWLKCYLDLKPDSLNYMANKFKIKPEELLKWSKYSDTNAFLDYNISYHKMDEMCHFMKNDIMNG